MLISRAYSSSDVNSNSSNSSSSSSSSNSNRCCFDKGNYQRAEVLLRERFAKRKALLGENHRDTEDSMKGLDVLRQIFSRISHDK